MTLTTKPKKAEINIDDGGKVRTVIGTAVVHTVIVIIMNQVVIVKRQTNWY